jgi:hypothetical protein
MRKKTIGRSSEGLTQRRNEGLCELGSKKYAVEENLRRAVD